MIIIDGRESNLSIGNYSNLEEVLVQLTTQEDMESRIVTDVFLNDEAFSELYPHQAEDISASQIRRLELRTVSTEQMERDVTGELPKVVKLIEYGCREVARLLRSAELAEGLELLQDTIAVSRDLLSAITVLANGTYGQGVDAEILRFSESIDGLLTEIGDAMSDEDWLLVSDLLEYEFLPTCAKLQGIIDFFQGKIDSREEQ